MLTWFIYFSRCLCDHKSKLTKNKNQKNELAFPKLVIITPKAAHFFSVSLSVLQSHIIKPLVWNTLKHIIIRYILTRPGSESESEMEAQYRNHDGDTSFSSLRVYLNSLSDTPSRFSRRAVSVSTSYDEMSRVRAVSGEQMRRTLRWYDLIGLGIGGMIGAGVFVTTGRASRLYAGPSIVVSYAIAGLCALLSAFCYTEFAVHLPVAGGAFSYIRITFGQYTLPPKSKLPNLREIQISNL